MNGWSPLIRAVRGELWEKNDFMEAWANRKTKEMSTICKQKLRKLLSDENVDINKEDALGLTALHHAVRGLLRHRDEYSDCYSKYGHPDAEPLDNVRNVSCGVLAGLLPTSADNEIVQLLLNNGAHTYIKDHQNQWTAEMHASYFNHADLLDSHPGNSGSEIYRLPYPVLLVSKYFFLFISTCFSTDINILFTR